jgi:outer membrane protein
MSRMKPLVAVILCYVIAFPMFGQTPELKVADHGFLSELFRSYIPHPIAKISFEDSPRIEKLMRAGNIYLSLRDAIALTLENNLDIEVARLSPKLQDANMLRADAGQLVRSVSSSIASGPSSAQLGALAGANSLGTTGSAGGNTTVLSGLIVQQGGSSIPNLDPALFVSAGFTHQTQALSSNLVTGTNFLVTQFKSLTYGVQQGFLTGTTVTVGLQSTLGLDQNAPSNQFNPQSSGAASISVTQNLLNGFGIKVNNRQIRISRNTRHISDLTFKQQVIATVTNVVNLYWDLVSFDDTLKVKQQTFELNKKLYEDNKRRAELGALAEIDIIQAEAEMKTSQQAVVTQETQVLQQEAILKSTITRSGMDNMAVVSARIVPTDRVQVPDKEGVRPVQDLIAEAFQYRTELEQSRTNLENSRLTTLGIKNNLLPSLQVTGGLSNSGLAGQTNSLGQVPVLGPAGQIVGFRPLSNGDVNPFFLGGYGSVLNQIFSRKFPNYNVAFQLTVPIRNRANQADLVTDQLNFRQSEIQDKQLQNTIKLNVINAHTAVQQARAAYDTAVEARRLQEQTLAGERRKYELGTSTVLAVVQVQRDTTNSEVGEVDALRQYIDARTALEQVLGKTLEDYDVSLEDAQRGLVGREPDLIPAVGQVPARGPVPAGPQVPAVGQKR